MGGLYDAPQKTPLVKNAIKQKPQRKWIRWKKEKKKMRYRRKQKEMFSADDAINAISDDAKNLILTCDGQTTP